MTSQISNTTDLKTGSADARVSGQREGLPGQSIADGEPRDLNAGESATTAGGADPARQASKGETIAEQPGCGPNVTDYPGLSDDPAASH